MASLHFEVDTTPMAHSVDSVKGHINAAAAAVTAMEAAVIATERDASKTICENVDAGFYMLVKSQISQKAVAAYTEMSAKQMTLVQLTKALDGVKRQMEADYAMICRRYTKLFASLNKALETRVRELDRPAMQLSGIRKNIIFDKLSDECALLLSAQDETQALSHTALCASLKSKTRTALKVLTSSIHENESYNNKVESILLSNGSAETADYYIPAMLLVSESLYSTEQIENVWTPQSDSWQNTAPLGSGAREAAANFSWSKISAEDKALVRKEFAALCEGEITDERMSKEVMRLFDESDWEEARS
ncbi:MAG: hypothetical protein Pg6A_10290 [Termitinemataceae bacterium]|nr:MAG: hypothetical protein Pg6A_10290 [Termitinemataceae bacterium]